MSLFLLKKLKERICLNRVVSMNDMVPLILEMLENGGKAVFTPTGTSMLPMLRDGSDTVTLEKPEFPLRRYYLPLYRREDGTYILHRIIEVSGDCYTMRGDHQLHQEYGITQEQILGVVCEFTRKGKHYSCTDWRYQLYCRVWIGTAECRKQYYRCRRLGSKIKRKILGK